jgi:MFS family permease
VDWSRDRLPRRAVLFFADAGRALAVGAIAVLSWAGALALWHLVVLGAIFGVVGAFFLPTYRAMPPLLVTRSSLSSANALTELSGQLGLLVGPLIGAAVVSITGPAAAFAFDSLSFVVSAASLLAIRLPRQQEILMPAPGHAKHQLLAEEEQAIPQPSALSRRAGGVRQVGRELREAAVFIAASPWLLTTIVIPAFGNAAFGGAMVVALPKLIRNVYGGGAWLLGAVVACVACGRMGSAFIVGQWRLRRRGRIAFGADVVASLAILAFGLPLSPHLRPVLGIMAGFVFGAGGGTFQIIWVTLLHELTPSEKLGRVASIDLLGSFCLQPLGFLFAGLVADALGPAYVFLGAGLLNLALYTFPLFLPGIQRVD